MNYLSIPPVFYPRCLMPTSTHFLPVVFLYAKFSCLMLLSLPVFMDGPLENLWRGWRGGGGGGKVAVEVQKKYSRKGKSNEKNSCTLINPKRYSCYGLKKLIQGIPAARKSPSPHPHNFSNGPSLKATVTRHLSSPTAWLVMTTHCHD